MNIHETLISLLIIGMFSVDYAQPRVLAEDQMSAQSPGEWLEKKCISKLGSLEHMEVRPSLQRNCNESVVSLETYLMESKLAQQSGKFDFPVKNLCEKIPIVEQCISDLGDFFAVCLEPEEKEAFKIDHNIIVSGMQFACHNGGDHLIRHLADGGRECIASKGAELQVCLDENVPGFFSTSSGGLFDLTNHPLMNKLPEKCSNLEKFKTCTVAVLETCPLPATANTFEALFTTVMKVTPCEKATTRDITVKSDEKTEAAEAQGHTRNTRQKRAAFSQKHAAGIVEQVTETWLRNFAN